MQRTNYSRFPWTPPRPRGGGFTLIELLVVIAIVAILASLVFPALGRGKNRAYKVKCTSGLRQLALAASMYWDDHDGRAFQYRSGARENGDTYWFGWIERGAEGQRRFELEEGALHPYLQGKGVEICPSFNYSDRKLKLKATGASYGYGYNFHLGDSSKKVVDTRQLRQPAATALFSDAAQVNTFQAPASPSNPMLEEFYYINAVEPTVHFRHSGRAETAFCDGHVESASMKPGTLDIHLPAANVGRLTDEFFQLW